MGGPRTDAADSVWNVLNVNNGANAELLLHIHDARRPAATVNVSRRSQVTGQLARFLSIKKEKYNCSGCRGNEISSISAGIWMCNMSCMINTSTIIFCVFVQYGSWYFLLSMNMSAASVQTLTLSEPEPGPQKWCSATLLATPMRTTGPSESSLYLPVYLCEQRHTLTTDTERSLVLTCEQHVSIITVRALACEH